MFIYWCLAILSLVLFRISKSNDSRKVSFIILSIIMFFVGAFRSPTVGTDTRYVYIQNFTHTTFEPYTWNYYTEFEPGFNVLMAFFKEYISNDYKLFYGFLFVLTFSLFIVFIRKVSYSPLLSLAFFVWFGYYTTEFNIMRQYLGVAVVSILIVSFLEKGKYLLYIVYCILLGVLVHKSLVIFALLPIFYIRNINNILNRMVLLALLSFSVLCFFVLKNIMVSVLGGIIPLIASERYQGYIINSLDETYNLSPIMIMLQTIFCAYIIWLRPNKSIFLYIYILGIFLRNCLVPIIPITYRLVDTLILFSFIVFSNLFIQIKGKQASIYRGSVLVYCFLYFYLAMVRNYNEVIPYSNWIFNN